MNPYGKSRLPLDITSVEFFQYRHSTMAAYAIAFIMENLYCTQCIFEESDPADAPFIRNHRFLSSAAHNKKILQVVWDDDANDYVAPFEEWFKHLVFVEYPLKGTIREWCDQHLPMSKPENQVIAQEKRSLKRIELEGMLKILVEIFRFVSYEKCAAFPLIQQVAAELGLNNEQIASIAKRISSSSKDVGRTSDEAVTRLKIALPHLKKWFEEVFPTKEEK